MNESDLITQTTGAVTTSVPTVTATVTTAGASTNTPSNTLYEKMFSPKEEKLIQENEKLRHDIKGIL